MPVVHNLSTGSMDFYQSWKMRTQAMYLHMKRTILVREFFLMTNFPWNVSDWSLLYMNSSEKCCWEIFTWITWHFSQRYLSCVLYGSAMNKCSRSRSHILKCVHLNNFLASLDITVSPKISCTSKILFPRNPAPAGDFGYRWQGSGYLRWLD